MHEKTLLYGALAVTAVGAIFGVYKAKAGGEGLRDGAGITPVPLIDTSSKGVAGTEVPVRLTASDGTGLRLASLRAQAAVEDPLALTELHLTFENPEDRVLEGTFRITLPQGASLSRFAMKVGDAWQEGEVVEKQAARRAYEDFLHRKQDPALMEQGAGNEFSARVFPIPARGKKEIIVTYAETIEIGAPYVLPLRGLPELGSVDVDVHVAGARAAEAGGRTDASYSLHQERFTPAGDFVVEGKRLPRSAGLRSGELAIARVVPFASSRPEPVGSAIVLFDTSASRGLGIAEQARTLRAILRELPADATVDVACFDQEVVSVFRGKTSEFGDKEEQAIVARGALGASDFERAIAWAGARARDAKATRVILVTDGVATAGETDAQKLRTKVEALRGAGVARMDAIATGGIRDDGFLRTVVRGVLDRDGVVLDAKLGPTALARRLGEATSSGVAVKVDGARWSWPDKLDGLQAGDEVLVYAELDAGRPVRVDVGGQQFAPDLRAVERPLVERAWAQAKIQSLVEAPTASPETTKAQIVALSTRHRVLSPHTALLVLETDWDYQRFNIDRTAKVDILAVRDGHVAVVESGRTWEEERAKDLRMPDPVARSRSGALAKGTPGAAQEAAPAAPAATAAASAPLSEVTADKASEATPEMARKNEIGDVVGRGGGGADDEDATGSQGQVIGLSGNGEGSLGNGFGAGGGAAPAPEARTARDAIEREEAAPGHAATRPAPRRVDRLHASPPPPPAPPLPRCPPGDPLCAELGQTQPTPPATATSVPTDGASATVRPGALTIERGIAADEVQPVIRGAVPLLRSCYEAELRRSPGTNGRLTIRFTIDPAGGVRLAELVGAPGSDAFKQCASATARALRFTPPGSSDAAFTQSFDLVGGGEVRADRPSTAPVALPYEGRFKIVMEALSRGDKDAALDEANRWHAEQPGDVLSLTALGEALEARGDLGSAARAYGSILELFSFRADSRRFAGERLERLKDPRALALAIDTYAKAAEQRPDHPASHRLYAFALLKNGEYERAFDAMKAGATRSYPSGRFLGVDRILKEDLGLIAAAWTRREPARAGEIRQKLLAAGGVEERGPSLRFVLVWETDANDVDFHIHDGRGGHAYYSQKVLPSGGSLYADVTTGYGPECFTIRAPREARAYPYTLQAHYYSRGPMGYGMGKLQVVEHDGSGNLSFDERPFIVMKDRAYVDMGTVDRSTKLEAARGL